MGAAAPQEEQERKRTAQSRARRDSQETHAHRVSGRWPADQHVGKKERKKEKERKKRSHIHIQEARRNLTTDILLGVALPKLDIVPNKPCRRENTYLHYIY